MSSSIIIILPRDLDLVSLAEKVHTEISRTMVTNDRLIFESGNLHAVVAAAPNVLLELDEEEKAEIRALVAEPRYFSFEFNDLAFAKRILSTLANDPNLAVDDDHGGLHRGSDFVRRMREFPAWEWRIRRPVGSR